MIFITYLINIHDNTLLREKHCIVSNYLLKFVFVHYNYYVQVFLFCFCIYLNEQIDFVYMQIPPITSDH